MSSIDPKNTRVVLIGTSIFKKESGFDNLPGVKGNILELAKLLVDPGICGIPENNITRLMNRKYPSDVGTKLAELARQAKDTLIVYYAGHGYIAGSPPELYLTTANTTTTDTQFNGLSIEKVRSAIHESGAKKKVLILDCCYSERAFGTMAGQAGMVKNRLDLKGTYTIAAAPANKEAIAPPGEVYTAFTGELLRVLKEGIDNDQEYISLEEIFQQIRTECNRRPELPEPQQMNVQDGGDILIAHNKKYKARVPSKPFILQGLDVLRKRIAEAAIPQPIPGQNLNIATWKLRYFGHARQARSEAALFYIAEILRQFDITAITSLASESELNEVIDILGRPTKDKPGWDFIYSTGLMGSPSDTGIAYVFNTGSAQPAGQMGQASPPRVRDHATREMVSAAAWWRSPSYARFRSGANEFLLVTAHIVFGRDMTDRMRELQLLADWVRIFQRHRDVIDKEIIVLGQFNTDRIDGPLFDALTSTGLTLAPTISKTKGNNLHQTNYYELILHYPRQHELFTGSGGLIDFYKGDWEPLFPRGEFGKMSRLKFSFAMADLLPVWAQIGFTGTG